MLTRLKKIMILGGGVGGLELATQLGKKLGYSKKARIVLVDQNSRHLWKPLLHEVATGSLDEDVDALSYLEHARNNHFEFQLGSVVDINNKNKTILLSPFYDEKNKLILPERRLAYDTLVIALGSVTNDFNIPGVKEHCVFIDSPQQACNFRKRIFNLFLKHSNNFGIFGKINIVIVGAGATGIELSAELHNVVKQLHSYGYKKLINNVLNIILIEASERILPALSLRISKKVHNELIKLGICVLTETMITSVTAKGLHTKHGKYIKADLIVWVAGVKAPDFIKNISNLETNRINQLVVKPTLQTTRDSDIFSIGDCTIFIRQDGSFVPPRAQAAHQMASLVQYNILAQMNNKSLKEFVYKDRGFLVSLSKYTTIGSLMGNLIGKTIMLEGCIARFLYLSLYRIHQITLHGYLKTSLIILGCIINRIIRPRLKLD